MIHCGQAHNVTDDGPPPLPLTTFGARPYRRISWVGGTSRPPPRSIKQRGLSHSLFPEVDRLCVNRVGLCRLSETSLSLWWRGFRQATTLRLCGCHPRNPRNGGSFGWLHPPHHRRFEGMKTSPPYGHRAFQTFVPFPERPNGGCNHQPAASYAVQPCSSLGTKPLHHRESEVSYLVPFPEQMDEWVRASIEPGAGTDNVRNEPNGPILSRKQFHDNEIRWMSPLNGVRHGWRQTLPVESISIVLST
jgi:hypothetical protein